MAHDVMLPPLQTFSEVGNLLSPDEATDIISSIKKKYPGKLGNLGENDFSGLLQGLFKVGAISEDLSLIPKITANAKKKDEIQALINKCEPLEVKEFVGREEDVKEVCKKLINAKYPVRGVNLFGQSGVGKTTLAQEIAKSEKLKDFKRISIDLRGIREMENVYFQVLEEFNLQAWDKDVCRFFTHLKTLKEKTLLILDNIEQLHETPPEEAGEDTESPRVEFLDFLLEIVSSQACQSGYLKLLLTSREKLDDSKLRQKLLSDHNVKPFNDQVSKQFLGHVKKEIPGMSKEIEEESMSEIVNLCKNIPYLLQCAKQMLREGFRTPSEVLERLKSQLRKSVPEEYACMAEQFESIPNDDLKALAVKISLLQRPFSISTAMKIAGISSNYDASIDLELLAVHKVISKVDEKKYDTHAKFKDFVKKYVCKLHPQYKSYKEKYEEGEKQFFIHFSGKMSKLAQQLDKEFVKVYTKLEGNRANFELAIDISKNRNEVFDVLLHINEHNKAALMGLFFEASKDSNERKKLYGQWAEIAEESEKWLTSTHLRCRQALQGADMEGIRDAKAALRIAEESLKKTEQQQGQQGQQQQEQLRKKQELDSVRSLFHHASGRIKWLHASILDPKEKKDERQEKIKEGIKHLEEALKLSEDATKIEASTMNARIINLIGNCYMELNDPSSAEGFYTRALEMKRKLVGSDNHWEMPTYYNQLSQVHEGRAMDMEKSFVAKLWNKKKITAEYNTAVEWMKKALQLQDALGVSDTEHTATFQRNLANTLIGIGEYDKALVFAKKCYENRLQRLGEHPQTVRILYLTGIIHEWRKDIENARESYEQAFEMEEALPEDNHSIVRSLIRDRLKVMYEKLRLKDKIAELEEKIKEIDEGRKEMRNTPDPGDSVLSSDDSWTTGDVIDTFKEVHITVNQQGGTYNHLSKGFILHFPPNCVTKATRIKCEASTSKMTLPSPIRQMESLVSSIVELGSCSGELKKPFFMVLSHCGVDRSKGYETIVKVFNDEREEWEEMEELPSKSMPPVHIPPTLTCIGVQLTKMTAVAVVSRLVTDTFDVPEGGCVVKSSVCNDVTLYFPKGAVDRSIIGSLQIIPIPDHIINGYTETIPSPVLLFTGFKNVIFSKPVRITVPRASSHSKYDSVRLLRLEGIYGDPPFRWEDITTDVMNAKIGEWVIEVEVQRFCGLWIWNTISGVTDLVHKAFRLYSYLYEPPCNVSFAAYQKKGTSNSSKLHLRLTCVANIEQDDLTKRLKQDHDPLEYATSHDGMRKSDKAFLDMKGVEKSESHENFFLQYLGSGGGACEKPLIIKTHCTEIDLHLCRDKETKNSLLCKLPLKKEQEKIDPPQVNSQETNVPKIWVEYCGITFDVLRELSDGDAFDLLKLFREEKVKDTIYGFIDRWYKGDGAEEFLTLLHKVQFNDVYETLNKPDQNTQDRLGHILNKLQYGHELTEETFFVKIPPKKLTETVYSMSTESIADYTKFGRHLGIREQDLKTLGSSSEVMKFWIENHKETGKVADLLKALRECWACDPAKQLAETITKMAHTADASTRQTKNNIEPQSANPKIASEQADITEIQTAEHEIFTEVTDDTNSEATEPESFSDVSERKCYPPFWKGDPDSSNVYRMKSNPRGLMVIINIEKFAIDPTLKDREELVKEITERKGSERDVDKLTELFHEKFNFKVCTLIDKPRLELLRELRKIAENPEFKDYDCLAVGIMSHGKDDTFYAYDGNKIKVSAVYNMFSNSMCENFRYKPKLFFIQACRGQRGSGFVVADGPSDSKSKDLDMADMLIAFSSFEDYTSYRDTERGSIFIQSLVSVFRKYADKEHIVEMLPRINKEVHEQVQEALGGRTQVPAPILTLRKNLYFWPGINFDEGP